MSSVRVAAQRFLHDLFSDCRFDNVSRRTSDLFRHSNSVSPVQFRQRCRQVHALTEADEEQEDRDAT